MDEEESYELSSSEGESSSEHASDSSTGHNKKPQERGIINFDDSEEGDNHIQQDTLMVKQVQSEEHKSSHLISSNNMIPDLRKSQYSTTDTLIDLFTNTEQNKKDAEKDMDIFTKAYIELYKLGGVNPGREKIELKRSIKIETSRLRHLLHINHHIK